jgi:hypothetical protein
LCDRLRERGAERRLRGHLERPSAFRRAVGRIDVAGAHDDLRNVVAGGAEALEDLRGEQRELVRPRAGRGDDGERLVLDFAGRRAFRDARADERAPGKRGDRGADAREPVLARAHEDAVDLLRRAELFALSSLRHARGLAAWGRIRHGPRQYACN